mgnify:FL=1|jgi:transposase
MLYYYKTVNSTQIMARHVILPHDFHQYDFAQLARKESNPKNRVRLIAMANIKDGMTLNATSKSLKVHWKTLQNWLTSFRSNGIAGLYVKTTKHKPYKLSHEVKLWISNFMKTLYSDQIGGRITGTQLLSLLKKRFSVECCLQTIYNTLHDLNLSWISCRSKHPKSDIEVQELYKKTLTAM